MDGVVKICGLMTERAVEEAFRAGADLGGVILGPARREVEFATAWGWAERWPGRLVAVLRGAPDAVWRQLFDAPWAGLQVYDSPLGDWVGRGRERGFLTIRPGVVDGARADADVLLLEGPRPGTGQRLVWEQITRPTGRFWLAGGLTPDNVAHAIQTLRPGGVDVSSGVERDGQKDPVRMREFVSRAREAMG